MLTIDSTADLEQAIERLVESDPRLAPPYRKHGLPPLRAVPCTLSSLLRIVTDQLISLKAGEAIWRRLEARFAPFDPVDLMRAGESAFRAEGLSGGKARTFLAAAEAATEGLFDAGNLDSRPDAEARAMLQRIRGVGPWTADIFLLTALRRADAWPAGDLALRVAVQKLLVMDALPTLREMETLSVRWRPYRSAAARLLWSHYRALKQMPQAII